MRILIDTNILISGLFYGGFLEKFLFELDEENFNVCVNVEIMSEYRAQISKKVLQKKKVLNEKLSAKFFSNLQNFEIKSDLKVCRDPKDDKFINCAIDAKAIYIVSGDNDLLTIKNFAGIEIVTAREFYDKYLKKNPFGKSRWDFFLQIFMIKFERGDKNGNNQRRRIKIFL